MQPPQAVNVHTAGAEIPHTPTKNCLKHYNLIERICLGVGAVFITLATVFLALLHQNVRQLWKVALYGQIEQKCTLTTNLAIEAGVASSTLRPKTDAPNLMPKTDGSNAVTSSPPDVRPVSPPPRPSVNDQAGNGQEIDRQPPAPGPGSAAVPPLLPAPPPPAPTDTGTHKAVAETVSPRLTEPSLTPDEISKLTAIDRWGKNRDISLLIRYNGSTFPSSDSIKAFHAYARQINRIPLEITFLGPSAGEGPDPLILFRLDPASRLPAALRDLFRNLEERDQNAVIHVNFYRKYACRADWTDMSKGPLTAFKTIKAAGKKPVIAVVVVSEDRTEELVPINNEPPWNKMREELGPSFKNLFTLQCTHNTWQVN